MRLWTSLWLALVLGLIGGGIALAQTADPPAEQTEPRPTITPTPTPDPLLESSLTYARVITGNVPVYPQPLQATTEFSPVKFLAPGYVWVSLADPQLVQQEDQHWYAINQDEYVQADYLEIYQPSTFRGLALSRPKPFAWVVFDAWTAAAPGEVPGKDSMLLKRYTIVTIDETQYIGDRAWYRVGFQHWLEQEMVGVVTPKPRPAGVGPEDKWIEIDLYEQTLAAYEGDRMVYATLVSSGLPWWQTETGLSRIWLKIEQAKMSGRKGYPDHYFLEDVPWSMYFNKNFALHGAYWHDRFGLHHSHGCVNLSLADAKWLFEWTTPTGETNWTLATEENPGTWVWVHESGQEN